MLAPRTCPPELLPDVEDEPEPEYVVVKIIVPEELSDPFEILQKFMEECTIIKWQIGLV